MKTIRELCKIILNMKKKIIIIEKCSECNKYFVVIHSVKINCGIDIKYHCNKLGIDIIDKDTIHPDCPLQDYTQDNYVIAHTCIPNDTNSSSINYCKICGKVLYDTFNGTNKL